MKNVFLILILLTGFMTASAQTCKPAECKPCPPGCCVINCSASKGDAASVTAFPSQEAQLAALVPGTPSCKMTKKEMKACMAACKSNVQTVSKEAGCQPTPACQVSPACKTRHTAAAITPAQNVATVPVKS